MRKLLLLVSAVVLVDTSFYAAITPLLPDLTEQFGLSKTGAGVLAAAYPVGTFVGGLPGGPQRVGRGGVEEVEGGAARHLDRRSRAEGEDGRVWKGGSAPTSPSSPGRPASRAGRTCWRP